jgi:hypothetical protein
VKTRVVIMRSEIKLELNKAVENLLNTLMKAKLSSLGLKNIPHFQTTLNTMLASLSLKSTNLIKIKQIKNLI